MMIGYRIGAMFVIVHSIHVHDVCLLYFFPCFRRLGAKTMELNYVFKAVSYFYFCFFKSFFIAIVFLYDDPFSLPLSWYMMIDYRIGGMFVIIHSIHVHDVCLLYFLLFTCMLH